MGILSTHWCVFNNLPIRVLEFLVLGLGGVVVGARLFVPDVVPVEVDRVPKALRAPKGSSPDQFRLVRL